MLGNSLQGIGEHYIAIPMEQVYVSRHLKDGTVRSLLRCQHELGDAFLQLRARRFSVANQSVSEFLSLPPQEVAYFFNCELRHLRLHAGIAQAWIWEMRFSTEVSLADNPTDKPC